MEPEMVVSLFTSGWAAIFVIEYFRRGRRDKALQELKKRLLQLGYID